MKTSFALVVVAAAAVLAVAAAQVCPEYTDCSDCSAEPGCGWCASSGVCMSGSSSGSNDNTCTGSDWEWSSCCNANTDCSSCVEGGTCGWCSSTNTCMAGQSSVSANGQCVSDGGTDDNNNWWWTTCPSSCHLYEDCSSCTSAADCGWCGNSGTCYSGSYSGPGGSNLCYDNWHWASCTSSDSPNDDDGVGDGIGFSVGGLIFFIVLVAILRIACYRRYYARRYRPVTNNNVVVATQPAPQPYYQQGAPAPQAQGYQYQAAAAPVPAYNAAALPPQQYAYQQPAMNAPPTYAPPPATMQSEFPPASAPKYT